jgi:hypothetical protein
LMVGRATPLRKSRERRHWTRESEREQGSAKAGMDDLWKLARSKRGSRARKARAVPDRSASAAPRIAPSGFFSRSASEMVENGLKFAADAIYGQ